jgi:acyl carrier protein
VLYENHQRNRRSSVATDHGDEIRRFISEEILYQSAEDGARLDPDFPLLASIDSLGIMQLVTFLEEELGIELAQDEITEEHFRTIADLERFLSQKTDAGE